MANRARQKNYRNHLKQMKVNKAKARYNWGMMVINANAKKIRNGEIDIPEGENK